MQNEISGNLVQIARERARLLNDKIAYANLRDGKEEQRQISYRQLDDSCRRIGAALQQRGAVGERILLLFPQGAEFVLGFFGTLYGGAIAVPAHTPKPNKRSWATFEAIVDDCRPRFIVTCRAIRDNIAAWSKPYPTISALELLCVEDLEQENSPDDWNEAADARTDIAFLQYTSGSTSTPKGVVVSHANLIHNARLTANHMGHDEGTVIVSWLPLFHDLGLIGIVIQTLYVGATCYMMSPAAFSGNPALWLQAISRYRATSSMSSDFGYRLCVKSIRAEQLEGVDLSSWRNALNAAEPIHASTLASFQEKFAPFGFSEDAFFPAYGLAEATLLSTTSRVGEKPIVAKVDKAALARGVFTPSLNADAVELVSSGRPADDMEVAIIDPDTRSRCADGALGEVWVRGASIASGYWHAPEASRQTFAQSPAGATEPHFLRTGDLGFLWNGELFIAGRLKDLIISRGRNIYPQDIELTVKDSHAAFRTVNGAAFSVERDDAEAIVVVHEIERTARNAIDLVELEKTVRGAVWLEHDISLADVVFIPPASLPKTTSGKVQRRLTKALYLSGELPLLRPRGHEKEPTATGACEAPAPERRAMDTEELQQFILAETLALVGTRAAAEATDSFGAIGIDSVLAAQLAVRLNDVLGLALEPMVFWQHQTPQLLARHLAPGPIVTTHEQSPKARSRDELVRALKAALGEPALEKQE
ncbi:AMP-binding protein [Mesorhizobium sp. NPDC059054]|uniref:AMP-binding protein n=1 Tax=Mesorhizobium sp. NPDC059054 TaxID=3346711 RepID=UPI003675D818